MRRRQLLVNAGSVALGSTIAASGLAAAESDRRLPPNENVSSTSIHPFPTPEPQEVSTGDWITHRIGWISPTKGELEDFLGKYDIRAWIDGEPIDDFDSYRGDINEDEDGWTTYWRYTTPPKSPGIYEFEVEFEFNEDLDNGKNEAGDVITVAGTYEVAPSGGRGKGR
ncbi:hypothetical protein ACFQS4_08505 [Saliphagus sp. GCM10025317]